jgi:hypothetical protein
MFWDPSTVLFTGAVQPLIFLHWFIHLDGGLCVYRTALILGLLVTPAIADEITQAEAAKQYSLGQKAESDIRKHFESKHMKVTVLEVIVRGDLGLQFQ